MATEDQSPQMTGCHLFICISTSILGVIGFFVWMVVGDVNAHKGDPPPLKEPTFTVESTTVNSYNLTSYNLTSDSRVFTMIDLGIRARNPNPTNCCYFFDFHDMLVLVTKGRHNNVMAQGNLHNFGLFANNETLFHVEAVGMNQEGAGRVNVSLTGLVGVRNSLDVTCVDVRVNISRSTSWYQKVDCNVSLNMLDETRHHHGLRDDCSLYPPPS